VDQRIVTSADGFLVGDGEMARLIRSKDWSATPLGPIERWPQSLRTTVSLCLASNFPINIIWGPEHTQIYNDGYRIVCGEAHPVALGQNYRVTWASAWPAIGEPFERALGGATSFLENQRMFLTRNGYLEETFFTFSTSPIRDESGGIGGLFHPVTETTPTMLAERRTRALRDLTASLSAAVDATHLAALTIETLRRFEFDLPFVLVYSNEVGTGDYRLLGQHGIADDRASPKSAALDAHSPWNFAAAARGRQLVEVSNTQAFLPAGRCGPYEEAPNTAFVLPVGLPGVDVPPMIVVAGASPRLPLDDRYRGFFELIAAALGAALAMVRAREDERRRADALAELDRAKTVFFSNVSHEFRTPLTLMMGPLEESLEQEATLPEPDRQRIELALRNGRRLLKLVNTLLDFSRIEAGKVEASYEATDLGAFTAELASNFRSATERAGLALVIDAEPLPEFAYVDRDMWEKVILNLLSNAFKFTFAGEIRVSIAPHDSNSARVTVSDTGTGIAAHELPRLFDRFHRVEGARGRSFEGSGIGLALVRELVQLHGGTLSVQSTLGIGSTFQIILPLGAEHLGGKAVRDAPSRSATHARVFVEEALKWLPDSADAGGHGDDHGTGDPHGAHREPAAGLPQATASGHVLLADDNADMRGYVRRLLVDQGYSVETVEHGEAALAAARRRVPDLILSDVMMPRLNGFELLDAVRDDAALKGIPFILLSARAGEEARVEGLQAGADDYLTKPFAARELTARVASAVNRARNRREAHLRDSEARLRELNADLERRVQEISLVRSRTWDLSPELLGVLNGQGIFESTNPAWATLLGWSEADLSQTVFSDYLHPDDVAPSWAALDAALQRGQPVVGLENRYRTKHGDYRWVSWVAVPEGGKVYCSARDITDTKHREAELAAAQETLRQTQKIEALGRLTGGVAHDFNNLLQVIAGGLHVIEHADDAALRERVLAGMRQATQRGSALTRQLLAFSRRQALNPQPVNLVRHIDGMRELLDRSLRGDVNARIALADDLWCVSIDPGELELAILNLCVNSRDAMANGGTIVLSAINASMSEPDGLNGDFVQLSVSDTGAGMSDEVMHRLFEPFFTTKDIGKGSGLGLAQVYGFAKQSGGTVRVHSVLGAGTTVTIYLPRSARQPAEPVQLEESAPQSPVLFRGSLLLVEDDDEVAALTQEMLMGLGFAVTRAASAAAALGALANQRSVDVVFSDIMMPGGMNGVQLARELKSRRPDLPILLTSGHAEAYEAQAEAAGLQILAKPFQLGNLVTAMSRVLKPH